MKTSEVIGIGIALGLGYVLYDKLFGKGKAVDSIGNAIASPIATVSNWLQGSFNVVPTGNVILPNGTKVPLSKLNVSWDNTNNVASFVYQGYGYIIRAGANGGPAYDTNGDYHAE